MLGLLVVRHSRHFATNEDETAQQVCTYSRKFQQLAL